jgi:predicted phosphoadenosine phosphosulfate sulfurtransferase
MEAIKNRYAYKGDDLTAYMIFKIEKIAAIIAEKEGAAFDSAYARFLASETYRILQRPDTLMWGENAEFVVDEYYREVSRTRSL